MSTSKFRDLEQDRLKAIEFLDGFVSKPYVGHKHDWENLLTEVLRLPTFYLDPVREALKDGSWRGKMAPIRFIRRCVRIPPEQLRPSRTKVDFGETGRLEEEQRKQRKQRNPKEAHEESLLFNPPRWKANVYVGTTADLKLPDSAFEELPRGPHGREALAIDFFDIEYDERGGWANDVRDEFINDRIAIDFLLDPEDDDSERDWNKLADTMRLSPARKFVLQRRAQGITREEIMNAQKTIAARNEMQAAWKWLDRNLDKFRAVIERKPERKERSVQTMTDASAHSVVQELNRRSLERGKTTEWVAPHPSESQRYVSLFDGEPLCLRGSPLIRSRGRRIRLQELQYYVIRCAKVGRREWLDEVVGYMRQLMERTDEELVNLAVDDGLVNTEDVHLYDRAEFADWVRALVREALDQYKCFLDWRKNPINPRPEWF